MMQKYGSPRKSQKGLGFRVNSDLGNARHRAQLLVEAWLALAVSDAREVLEEEPGGQSGVLGVCCRVLGRGGQNREVFLTFAFGVPGFFLASHL